MNKIFLLIRIVFTTVLAALAFSTSAQKFSVVGGNELSYNYYEDYKSTSGINTVSIVYGTAD